MNRYSKVLNSRFILFCLIGLAGWLVVSEGYMWWTKLSDNRSETASTGLQQDAESGTDGLETQRSSEITSERLSLDKQPTLSQVTNVPEGEFKYGGSTTWAPLRDQVNPVIAGEFSQFELQYTSPSLGSGRTAGSGTGIEMLLSGELDFSQASRPLKEEEIAAAQQDGYTLSQVAIAIDGIAIAVNPDLGITRLTIQQLKQIYTGKVTNWQQLGGPNVEIAPYARSAEDSGTAEFFSKAVLSEEQYAPWVQFVENTTAALRQVSANKGGIYYASASEVVSQCSVKPLPISDGSDNFVSPYQPPYVESSDCPRYRNRLNTQAFQTGAYPLTRKLFLIVKENGDAEEQAGVAYANMMLTDEAQQLIEAAGFIPVDD